MTNEPDDSSKQLAERVGATARLCEVVAASPLSTSIYELVLRGDAATLAGAPGNDVMIRLIDAQGRFVRRRYSVRALDEANDTFTLWITVDHEGPGSTWVKHATTGELVDVIGPRGKVLLDPVADWHLFIGDASGLAAFYRMAQSIEVPGRAIFIVEIDAADDAVSAPFDEGLGVTGIFVDRQGRSTSDPEGLLRGLAAFELPPDLGHAYLFGEFHVMRVLESALLDRGLLPEHVSHKAFWRSGRSNADHGEPIKTDA
ncbi:MAG TPA: siderophore-interacting protein [Acidimicrobiales bacterium]|nr:siderophore-interacting protein [Acidimicrobiales bacterium]